jgi:protein-S-isoprenylcysteine O-methyltransferase Ste14
VSRRTVGAGTLRHNLGVGPTSVRRLIEIPLLRVALRLLADTILVGLALFLPGATLSWAHAWILLGVLLTVRLLGAFAVHQISPALLRERAKAPVHNDQPRTDRVLVLAILGSGFLGLPLLASLDHFYWQSMPAPSPLLSALGLLLFTCGWILKNVALRVNAFAVTTLRLQTERAHRVVETGVYSVIRHPFYAADLPIFLGLGLWLQSFVVVLVSAVPIGLMLLRLTFEEAYLHRQLPGYTGYTKRVRHRLVPGIW